MRNGLAIRTDFEVGELRRQARLEADGRVVAWLLAIAGEWVQRVHLVIQCS